jgi:hypothetical protein
MIAAALLAPQPLLTWYCHRCGEVAEDPVAFANDLYCSPCARLVARPMLNVKGDLIP